MKILVTGANGYIGSKVVQVLCDEGHKVLAMDINDQHIDNRASFICANLFQENDNWYDYCDRPDVCLHLAWRDGFIHNSPKHMGDLSGHFSFLTNLIDHGLPRVIAMGTMHEIGYFVGAVNEATPCNPMSLYGVAKNALRKALELYCAQHNCVFQWLRAFYIFGDDSLGNSIFAKIRKAASEGASSFPLNSGKNEYDFISVNELAHQISSASVQSDIIGVINVCSGKPVALGTQVKRFIAENNLNISLDFGKFPDRPYDSPCLYGDSTKIESILKRKQK